MKKFYILYSIAIIILLSSCSANLRNIQKVVIKNPSNGHYYKLTTPMDWIQIESQAVEWGGHLVTINDRREELWLKKKFGKREYFWIGFNDIIVEGNWEWASGETVTYTNWWQGEPNNLSGDRKPENVAIMNWCGSEQTGDEWISYYGDGWNDIPIDGVLRGIVEIEGRQIE